MLHADDAGVVSQSPEQPKKMVGVVMVVCAAFGFILSDAKTKIMCSPTKGMPKATIIFSKEAAGQVQPNERVGYTSGGTSTTTPTCPSRSTGTYATHGAGSGSTTATIRPTEHPPRAKILMLKAEVLETKYSYVTRSPRACHYDTLR